MEVDVIPAAEGVDLLAMARFADHLMTEATGEVTLMLFSIVLPWAMAMKRRPQLSCSDSFR